MALGTDEQNKVGGHIARALGLRDYKTPGPHSAKEKQADASTSYGGGRMQNERSQFTMDGLPKEGLSAINSRGNTSGSGGRPSGPGAPSSAMMDNAIAGQNRASPGQRTLPSGVIRYTGQHGETAFADGPPLMGQPQGGQQPSTTGMGQPQGGSSDYVARMNQAANTWNSMGGGGGQVSMPGAPDPAAEERQSLLRQIQHGLSTNMPGERLTVGGLNSLMGRLNEIDGNRMDAYGDQMGFAENMADNQNTLQQQSMSDQAAGQRQQMQTQGALQAAQIGNQNPYDNARAAGVMDALSTREAPLTPLQVPDDLWAQNPEEAQQMQGEYDIALMAATSALEDAQGDPSSAFQALQERLASVDPETNPQTYNRVLNATRMIATQIGGASEIQRFAEGGMVGPPGGQGQMAPQSSPVAVMQNYERYSQLAQQLGLQPMSMDEFVQQGGDLSPATPSGRPETMPTSSPEQMGVMGFANGGMIPEMPGSAMGDIAGQQVDGKMVTDPNPNAPTDSIPAVIDGQHPAALDSGEMVMPKDVVMYYGTEKISKMIEQARNKMGASNGTAGPQQPTG